MQRPVDFSKLLDIIFAHGRGPSIHKRSMLFLHADCEKYGVVTFLLFMLVLQLRLLRLLMLIFALFIALVFLQIFGAGLPLCRPKQSGSALQLQH